MSGETPGVPEENFELTAAEQAKIDDEDRAIEEDERKTYEAVARGEKVPGLSDEDRARIQNEIDLEENQKIGDEETEARKDLDDINFGKE